MFPTLLRARLDRPVPMSLTATSHALLRGDPAPPAQEEPTEPVERAALRLAALLGRGEYAAALEEPLAATLLDAPDCAAAVQAYLAEHAPVAPAAVASVVWLGAASSASAFSRRASILRSGSSAKAKASCSAVVNAPTSANWSCSRVIFTSFVESM